MISLKKLSNTFLTVIAALITSVAYAQKPASIDSSFAQNAVGPGIAISTGHEHNDNSGLLGLKGFGIQFNAQIRLNNSLAFVPSAGIELPYPLYLGAAARYFISRKFYLQGGAIFQVAGDGLDNSGIRPTAGLGFELYTNGTQFLDFNFHADRINIDNRMQNVVGLRVTYNFILPKSASEPGTRANRRPAPMRPRLFPGLPF